MLSNVTLNTYLVPSVGLIDCKEEYMDKFIYKLSLIILLFARTILMQLIDPLIIIISIKQQRCNSGNNRRLLSIKIYEDNFDLFRSRGRNRKGVTL